MTLSTTGNTTPYVGNGTTTVFTFSHKFFTNADLVVDEVTDSTKAIVRKYLTTDYTVSGAGDAGGGTVTMVTAPATGITLHITRWVDATQATDFIENGDLPADSIEDAYDKLTALSQQVLNRVGGTDYDRGSVAFLGRSSTVDGVWDADGKLLTNGLTAVSGTDIPTLTQVQSLITTSTGNLPTPTDPGQDDYILVAGGGAWAVTSPATVRTSLGLGTSAALNIGIVAGNVVEVQSGVELPALGSANLTGRVAVASRAFEHANYR